MTEPRTSGRAALRRLLAWSLPAALLAAPACWSAPRADEIVLARVNGESLTLEDARDTFLSSHTGHGVLIQGAPAVRELAARIIERRLFLAEAEALGITANPEVIEVVDRYRRKLAGMEFWKREVDQRVVVDPEEVEAFYAKTDMALELSMMEVGDRPAAERLRESILAGGDFAALASAESIHPSRPFGGQLSYVRRGELDPVLEQAVFALEEPGSVTQVVETGNGFAFARLDQRTVNPIRPDREKAMPQIRGILKGREEDRLRAEAEARLMRDVAIRDDLLTRAALLDTADPDAAVVESAGRTLDLRSFRDLFDLQTIEQAGPDEVARAARDVAREWGMERSLDVEVERAGLLDDPGVARKTASFRHDVILTTLYGNYVYAGVDVTEDQVRAYYDAHLVDEFTRPAEVRLAYIVVADEQQAREVLARLDAGEAFGDLAQEVSIDATSAMHSGRIGWVRPGQLLPEVEARAFAMEVGERDGPIATEAGHFVLQVLDRAEEFRLPYEMARNAAHTRRLKELQLQAYQGWAQRLKERAEIEIDDEGIAEAVAWFDRAAGEEGQDGPTRRVVAPDHAVTAEDPGAAQAALP